MAELGPPKAASTLLQPELELPDSAEGESADGGGAGGGILVTRHGSRAVIPLSPSPSREEAMPFAIRFARLRRLALLLSLAHASRPAHTGEARC